MKYDVVVVGAGLVGTLMVRALLQLGLRVAWVERTAPNIRFASGLDARSLVISQGTALFLQELGLWDAISPSVEPILNIVVSETGCFSKTFLTAQDLGVPALGYVINIQQFNQILASDITTDALTAYCPATWVDLQQDETGVRLRLDSEPREIEAQLCIAADGANSLMREHLGIACDMRDYQQIALVANVTHTRETANTAHERFFKGVPVALLPRSKYTSGLVWPWPQDQQEVLKALTDADLLKQLQDIFGFRVGRFTALDQRYFYPLKQHQAQQLVMGRVVLVGNAAHQLHPVGGQGFNLGVRDVKILSDVLRSPVPPMVSVLQSYQQSRARDHAQLGWGTDQLLSLFARQDGFSKMMRRLGLLTVNTCSVLRGAIGDRSMGLT
jgi:2-octaprenyl-6-methoxyphenol hydroxylase